jgi:hypothetical protein
MPNEQMGQFQAIADNLADILDGIFHSLNSGEPDDHLIIVAVP